MDEQSLPSPETLDVIYDATKNSVDEQLRDIDGLDGKLGLFFSTATVLIGLPAAAVSRNGIAADDTSRGLFIAAVAFYALAGIAGFLGFWVQRVRRAVNAAELWPLYWNDTAMNAKIAVVDDVAKSFEYNRGVLDRKANWLRLLQLATLAEALLVAFSLIATQL